MLGGLGSHVRRQLAAKGITAKVAGSRLVEILVVVSMILLLSALLLPALARAKAKAMSISLLNDLKQRSEAA